MAATGRIIDRVREAYGDKTADADLVEFVKRELKALLADPRPGTLAVAARKPTVYLIAGVNGSGKTTSIAKLRSGSRTRADSILLAACDTFRAAAADQLWIWASGPARTSSGASGADPASVAHDACDRALAREIDVLIVDTAGRLHTQTHLMRELEKIRNVLQRGSGAPSTSKTSCGAPGILRWRTLRIFSSSRIRCVWVWSRPAVSTIRTSIRGPGRGRRRRGRRWPGRRRGAPDDVGAGAVGPDRELVGGGGAEGVAGGQDDRLPSSLSRCASLAIEVVLPEPLTPAIR